MKKHDHFAQFLLKSTDTIKELVILYFVTILCASLAFVYFESIAFKDAVWMSFVTATSTGYGDFFPKTTGGRVVAVGLMHMVILVLAPLMVYRILDAIDQNDFTDAEQKDQQHKTDWIITQLQDLTGQKYEPVRETP